MVVGLVKISPNDMVGKLKGMPPSIRIPRFTASMRGPK
jgi:hypothetical protein